MRSSNYGAVMRNEAQNERPRDRARQACVGVLLLASACLSPLLWRNSGTSMRTPLTSENKQTLSKTSSSVDRRPNFVYILADDLSWNSLGYSGFDLAGITPLLDRLATEGITFSEFYGMHLCTPARASLLTGKYPIHLGMQFGAINLTSTSGMPADVPTFPELLLEAGYNTHMVGKWHLGHSSPKQLPTSRGFETFLGYLLGAEHYFSHQLPEAEMGTNEIGSYYDFLSANSTFYEVAWKYKNQYSGHVFFERANELIREHAAKLGDEPQPLLLYVAAQNVHAPLDSLPDDWFTGEERASLSNVVGNARLEYAKSLIVLDKLVNGLVDTLRKTGLADNTYLIFSGDNGGCSQGGGRCGPLRGGKGNLFEGGTRVPAFVWSPLLPSDKRGTVYSGMVHISDWFPTILELAGIDADPGDGVSLAPVLRGEVQRVARTEMIYNAEILAPSNAHMFVDAPVAIRIGRYKAIFEYEAYWAAADEQQETDDLFGQDGGCFRDSESVFQGYLFDLEKDPYETENLMETHIDIKKNVLDRLEGYLQTVRIEEENMDPLADVLSKWENAGNAVVPWRFTPEDCEGYTVRDCI